MKYGLVAILNNEQLEKIEAQARAELAPANEYAHLVDRLSGWVETRWQSAYQAKQEVQQEMLRNLRQREGQYDPDKLAAIRAQRGSEVFMQITGVKCRAFESWLLDMLFPTGERPWYCGPTPLPELPADVTEKIALDTLEEVQRVIAKGFYVEPYEVYQRARELRENTLARLKDEANLRAERIEDVIDDMFIQGQWYEAVEDMLGDLTTLPAGILKGPVIRKKRALKWVEVTPGNWQPMATDELVPVWYSPSPLDIYPSPDSSRIGDGYLFERIATRPSALASMIGVPGWKAEAIRAVLADYPGGYRIHLDSDHQRNEIEQKRHWMDAPDANLDMVEFHGEAPGSLLLEWGMTREQVPNPDAFYQVTLSKIGRYVVRCVLNENPLGTLPYAMASFDRIKGAFWGRGLPAVIRDVQDVCNAAARALVNNMGIASGPIGEVELDRLAEGEDATQLWPWRMIQSKSSKTTPAPAVRFHNVSSHASELLAVYQHFSHLADVYSGVQSYDHGVAARSGSAATASGLSMLINASSRQVRRVVRGIDRVIEKSVRDAHTAIMLYGDDPDVKGDVNIEARGAAHLMVREQAQARRMEFLGSTANPIDMSIIGPEGRAELLREAVKALDIPVDRVIPDRDKIVANVRAAAMAAVPQAGPPGVAGLHPQGEPPAIAQAPGDRKLPLIA